MKETNAFAKNEYEPSTAPRNVMGGCGSHVAKMVNRPCRGHESPTRTAANEAASQVESGEPLKRQIFPRLSATQKRRRPSYRSPAAEVERTIDINDIFKNGQSKHKITRYPGDSENWWILWCEEHDRRFNSQRALTGAGIHLASHHGKRRRTNENAIKLLGYKVLNCTPALVEANNRALVGIFSGVDSGTATTASE